VVVEMEWFHQDHHYLQRYMGSMELVVEVVVPEEMVQVADLVVVVLELL
jgi:hypothetical protein